MGPSDASTASAGELWETENELHFKQAFPLKQLCLNAPPKVLIEATILSSNPIWFDCEDFLNSSYGLEITYVSLYKRKAPRPRMKPVSLGFADLD